MMFVLFQGLARGFCMMFVLFQGLARGFCMMFVLFQDLAQGLCMIFCTALGFDWWHLYDICTVSGSGPRVLYDVRHP